MSLIHYSRLMMRTLLLCLLVLCSLDRSMAAEDIARAKILFQQGDYKGAVTLYESLLQKRGPHSGLYYDLGTSYYELGDLGHAVLAYERCLHLDPRHEAARHNRDLTLHKTIDRLSDGKNWFATIGEQIAYLLPMPALVALGIGFFAGALFFGVLFFLARARGSRRLYFYLGLGCMIVSLSANALILHWIYADRAYQSLAVITSPETNVYTSAEASSEVAFTLHEGSRVKLTGKAQGEWQTITLADGRRGWVKNSSVEAVLPR